MRHAVKWLLVASVSGPAIVVGICAYAANALSKVVRVAVQDDPADLGLKYEDVMFPSAVDGLLLSGWYLVAPGSERCIVMVHGGERHRADASIRSLDIARGLVQRGYNVLMFDLRGHGQSEGERQSGGYYERRDVHGAIEYVKSRGIAPCNIGLLGFSLGAAIALLVAAEAPEIPSVVADSAFADLTDIMTREMPRRSHLPPSVLPVMLWLNKIMFGVDCSQVRPLDAVGRISPRPILFIHGERDEAIPVHHTRRLWEASADPGNELWIVPGAAHVQSYCLDPRAYLERVAGFFDRTLGQSPARATGSDRDAIG